MKSDSIPRILCKLIVSLSSSASPSLFPSLPFNSLIKYPDSHSLTHSLTCTASVPLLRCHRHRIASGATASAAVAALIWQQRLTRHTRTQTPQQSCSCISRTHATLTPTHSLEQRGSQGERERKAWKCEERKEGTQELERVSE